MKELEKIESILYVEDEQSAREELSEFLKYFCKKLYVAKDGQEGLELYKKYDPEIIVTDIKMPKMNGIEMAKAIFAINQETHIIFTTAFTEIEYLQQAIEIHTDGYVIKPINLEILDDILKKVIKLQNIQHQLNDKIEQELKKKAELETILATTADGIAIVDLDLNYLYVNNAYEKMIEYTLQELREKKVLDINYINEKEMIDTLMNKGSVDHFEKSCSTKSGKKIVVNMSLSMMPDAQSILIATKDITKEVYSQKRIEEYLEIIDENIITSNTDLDGIITYASKAFCTISKYSESELIGQNHSIVRDKETSKEIYEELWETITQDKIWTGELINRDKEGKRYYVKVKIYPIFDQNGIKTGYTSIREDITNLKRVEELAIIDSLTGVYNRYYFNEVIENYIQTAKRNNELICFAMVDIDFFKQYNDTYGHQAGDNTLKAVSASIKDILHRSDDYFFRLGGEEFGVLFKSNSKEYATSYVEKFVHSVEALQIIHEKSLASKYVTISAGLTCELANDIKNQDTLYKYTDDLLYQAKHKGRNRVVCNKGCLND